MNGKVNNQNNIEEVVGYYHSQKSISHTYNTTWCVHSETVAVCSCSYLAQSRTKSYYLYVKKPHYTSTNSKEEAGIFVHISCLTQRK